MGINVLDFWNTRYDDNWRGSGDGSRGKLAAFKAWVVNSFVTEHDIRSVVDLGCGDGNMAGLIDIWTYTGVDISSQAVMLCQNRFINKARKHFQTYEEPIPVLDMALSLDVIYHILDDNEYRRYMALLFAVAKRYVCIYSCDFNGQERNHIRPRKFTDDVPAQGWALVLHMRNMYPSQSWSQFYFYERTQ